MLLQINKKNTENIDYQRIRCFIVWSRGESNPCPNIATISFLHAYFLINCRHLAGKKQTNLALS